MKKVVFLLSMLVATSCAVEAQSISEPQNKSGKTLTYGWLAPDMKSGHNPMYNSPFSKRRLESAFDAALTGKGLVKDNQNPDLLLQFHTYTQRVKRNYGPAYPPMYGWGWGRFGWRMPYYYSPYAYGGSRYSTVTTDGTLVLDVINTKTGEMIWQREITGDVSNANRLDKQINKGVKKIMKNFPASIG